MVPRSLSRMASVSILLALVIGFNSIATAQNPGFIMRFENNANVLPGSNFTVRALLDNPGGDLAGWSAVVCHDSNIEILIAETGEAASIANGGAPCDFVSTVVFPGEGVRQGVIVSFPGQNELPISTEHELILLEYTVLGADGSDTLIEFCDLQFSPDSFYSDTIVIETTGISIVPTTISAPISIAIDLFIRGEINGDTSINIADAMFLLSQLFSGGPEGSCADANDVNDDGSVNLGDPITLLAYLFSGGVNPSNPFPTCGIDPSGDTLGCENFLNCP
ncbi:MAG: hypothetical protein HOI29_00020 [Planctomycetes bacterium]|jgi:hypothetical protein|nr:hypothetical protein [Planctomycetota bacterium]MBT6453581.1 hypothetical protein [Planctomycetota bacterium]MBT6542444.1 hypothetical protein [Planctomycetota bacterium]MBT6783499.1 hypothetical protein [Planctomycetota bacterium]MBT6969460.1 hypothetical protein [Planctomycetota bacterium]